MKILHLNPLAATGGAEALIASIIKYTSAHGVTSVVAMADGPYADRYRSLGVNFYPLPLVQRDPSKLMQLVKAIASVVESEKPDIIHAHNPTMMLAATLLKVRFPKVKLLATLHGNAEGVYRKEALISFLFPGTVKACGPFIAQSLAKYHVNVETLTNGIPPAPASSVTKEDICSKYGLDPEKPLAVGVGRLAPMKRWHLAIDAVPSIPDLQLIIFGEGQLRSDLEKQIEFLKLQDRVLLPGAISNLRSLLPAFDLALVTSGGEGFSLAVLELLAAKVPVIAGFVPGICDTVDESTGFIVEPEDAESVARGVHRCLHNPQDRARRVAKGAQFAAENSEARMLERYFAAYRSLAEHTEVKQDPFLDWRWDEVPALRLLSTPDTPAGFGDRESQRDEIAGIVHRLIPNSGVRFVDAGEPSSDGGLDEAMLSMHKALAESGSLGLHDVAISRCGNWVAVTYSHYLGDATTVMALLEPLLSYLADPDATVDSVLSAGNIADGGAKEHRAVDKPFPPDKYLFLKLWYFVASTMVRKPVAVAKSVKDVLKKDILTSAPEQRWGTHSQQARYSFKQYVWMGEAKKPGAVNLAWGWWHAFNANVESDTLDPNRFWLVTSLRPVSKLFTRAAGNMVARVRIHVESNEKDDVSRTIHSFKAEYLPAVRAAVSSVPQAARQLLRSVARKRNTEFSVGPCEFERVPETNLQTAWSYMRTGENGTNQLGMCWASPGGVNVNLYERADGSLHVMISLVGSEALLNAARDAFNRVAEEAGYQLCDDA